jgi:sortase A
MWTAIAIVLLIVMIVSLVTIGRRLSGATTAKPASREPQPTARRGFVQRYPWARKALSALSVALLLGAAAMVGYPYFSNLYQQRVQSNLDAELASNALEQKYRSRTVGDGDALTRLKIPALDVEIVVVEGVTDDALRAGAGHYPSTPLPCEIGNVAIAGHRTTFGRPFHNLDLLAEGDTIELETPIGTCTYEITVSPFVVAPSDVGVIDNTPDEALLTLTTCNPKGSARERLIVHATMVSSEFFET